MENIKKEFYAELQKIPDMDAAYFCLPFDAIKEYGKKHMIKVKATIDGVLYRGSLVDMGLGTMLGVNREIRKKIGKNPGDTVHVILEPDTAVRTVDIPVAVKKLLSANKKASDFFSTLSYTNKKEYINWITSAKRDATKSDRLSKMGDMLINRKKNPFEK